MIKYIHKYIYIGFNCITIQVDIKKSKIAYYFQERYIGPSGAIWQIFEFLTYEEFLSV